MPLIVIGRTRIQAADALLGAHPEPKLSWKSLQRDPELETKLRSYFQKFKEASSLGIDKDVARSFIERVAKGC